MPNSITVRVQSPSHGTKRIECKSQESISTFLKKVQSEFDLRTNDWRVCKDRGGHQVLNGSKRGTLLSQSIKHGDMVYIHGNLNDPSTTASNDWSTPIHVEGNEVKASCSNDSSGPSVPAVDLDEVDSLLEKDDGLIHRKRNEQLCQHGLSGKCVHCVPLEPYDDTYLRTCDPPIKFLSFHSYLRKLTGGVDKGKFASLENLRCTIKSGCKEHPPWPGGICTKCQPNAITLNRQVYRHVDYIILENPLIAENFLNYWRNSGSQRLGILYGKYEVYPNVPLGIKATVVAIYEPPQISDRNHIQLLPDPNERLVNGLASKLGLCPVGWIFTDLLVDDLLKRNVKHFRGNLDTYFLSAEECIMAATFQNKYPNPCRFSSDGYFGSKFVSIIVTGDKDNQINFEGYQTSNQCMSLVRDQCLIPTKDAAQLGYIKESSNTQYVPDVFYKEKDEYGNEVTQLARPLPVEYLLVDMPVTFPVKPQFSFSNGTHKPFPIENRQSISEVQDFNALMVYMGQFTQDQFLEALSDFHLLIFLASFDMLPLKAQMDLLLEAVKTRDPVLAARFQATDEWATVKEIIVAHQGSSVMSPDQSSPHPSSSSWTCAHCTFINPDNINTCEICSLPKQ